MLPPPPAHACPREMLYLTMCVMQAIALVNGNRWGNGTAIFTNSGAAARKYTMEIEAGQVRGRAAHLLGCNCTCF